MSQKTNKTSKSKSPVNAISNMDDCHTSYTECSNSLVDSSSNPSSSAYNTAKKQTNKKKNSPTDCR